MLEARGVRHVYADHARTVEALRDVTFSVAAGELVCVVGPSGCGKTTLLKCLAGLLSPTAGEVMVEGTPVTGPAPGMAVVFQEYGRSLFPWMHVADNVELPLRLKGLPKVRRVELVERSLEAVGLTDVHRAYPWQLSGGMQQRVAIARSFAESPRLLLMDEPFGALDEMTRERMQSELLALCAETGAAVVFVTHSIPEAVYLSHRVVVMSARPGKIREVIEVDLGDATERGEGLREEQAFFTAISEVREALHSEHNEQSEQNDHNDRGASAANRPRGVETR